MDKKAEVSGQRGGAREAILDAFRDIVLESGYDGVRVSDVVKRSGVGRSTFYEHFQDREDLLRDSLRGPFHLLAQLAAPSCDMAQTAFILKHFAQHASLATSLVDGAPASIARTLLAELIRDAAPAAGARVYAAAGAQIGAVAAWLNGDDKRTAEEVAQSLRAVTLALVR
ncbi:MAG TPA: TetR family transcriptional regulator [Candidatus Baltobacteraceae bacterium]|nr:TetR family transcriptional regulator [Candidatus Baltobacteraceae bacterium]